MNWRPIDFQGVIDINNKIVKELEEFLKEKEGKLALEILRIIPISSAETPDLPLSPMINLMKLSHVVEVFAKRISSLVAEETDKQKGGEWVKQLAKDINRLLWNFTEVLESSSTELFQRIEQLPIDRWDLSLLNVVSSIKESLIHYIDDLIWVIPLLEKPLNQYYQKFYLDGRKKWNSFFSFSEDVLDSHLLKNLEKTKKFLIEQYEDFQKSHSEYIFLNDQAKEFIEKLKMFSILASLESIDQNIYLAVFRFLKLIELNQTSKSVVATHIKKGLKRLTSVDNLLRILHVYYLEIKKNLFKASLEWKLFNHEAEDFENNFEGFLARLKRCQDELKLLMYTMGRYRAFILMNDPNPYVRSRWGFSEWIVGAEPAKAKRIADMIYAANELDECFTRFNHSVINCQKEEEEIGSQPRIEIEDILHSMGQPLISKSMMKELAVRLLNNLKMSDEIGSCDISIIDYVEDVLSKVMRLDWKYHVLHEISLFNKIYHLHQGLIGRFDDPSHAFRLERFRLLLDQIKVWVGKENIYSHIQEIDLDMNDMKTYLQDFLAVVQRAERERSREPISNRIIQKLKGQLLDYRYLFGQFFSLIMSKNLDGVQLRNTFLFVDQYFESVESCLNDMRIGKK